MSRAGAGHPVWRVRHRRHTTRPGTIYVAVLGAATIVMILGLSGLTAVRIKARTANAEGESKKAHRSAHSAIVQGLFHIQTDSNWRTTFTNGTWVPYTFGGANLSWKVVDEQDGDLADDPTEPVRLHGKGEFGSSTQLLSVLLEVTKPQPMDALRTAVHSAGELYIKGGKSLTATGAPASTNGNFKIDGTLFGSVEAATQTGGGTVTGTVTIPAPAKNLPAATVFDDYKAKATILPYSGDIDTLVIAPGINEYILGQLNPDGVYFIDTVGNDLKIRVLP